MATPIPKNDARFSLAEIALATSGRLVANADASEQVEGVVIDSRAVVAGNLFVAVRGDNHDGAAYIPAAASAGAAGLLVDAEWVSSAAAQSVLAPVALSRVEVADTTHALGDLAAFHRQRWGGRVVAITGSAGKTTTKELTAAALEGAGARVLKTLGNLNNQFGVPMMLLCAGSQHDTAVLELGTSGPGEIARLGEIARPQVATVVLAALAHTQGLGSLEAVADEKASLWAALAADGTAIVNADDAELMRRVRRDVNTLSFGTAESATVRLLDAELRIDAKGTRTSTRVNIQGLGELSFDLAMLGRAAALDACAAIAAVIAVFGLGETESDRGAAIQAAVQSLSKVPPTPGRMACRATRWGVVLCDDSYNANARSMALGLETLHELAEQTGGRSIAVLADMKDLGHYAQSEHVRIGELAVRLGVDVLVGCGPEMAHATSAAARLSAGRLAPHPTRVAHVMAPLDAVALVQSMCRPGDVVLIKGSRAMAMERVVTALAEKFGGPVVIYYFLFPLSENPAISYLNVLRYVPFRVLAATTTAMFLTFGLYPWFIRHLQTKQIGQVVRKDGPESHFSKAGTPTMGGALILLALVISTVLWADPTNTMVWLVTAVTALYGGIGFIDDSRKIKRRDTGGLSARYKLLLQFTIAFAVCGYLWYGDSGLPADWVKIRDLLNVPFVAFDRHPIALPTWLYVVLAAVWVVGISNAVNLTDGLDGLAIGPVMINAATYGILAYLAGLVIFGNDIATYLHIPSIDSVGELAIFCGALIGAGVGFLWYNTYPAQVFMGDVGSLALGGGLGMLAVVTKNELLSLVLSGIFIVEAVSVIAQVTSFKLTGKRVFLMAPIHHHFEKKGWPEPRIIVRGWIIAIMLALASLATLKLR